MRGYRTGVQANFFEKQMDIRQNGFGGNTNFENANMQFNWIIISAQPETSSRHRNTFVPKTTTRPTTSYKRLKLKT